MLNHPNPCGRCGRFFRDMAERMAQHGFGQCRVLPVWIWRSPKAPCALNPSRFEIAA